MITLPKVESLQHTLASRNCAMSGGVLKHLLPDVLCGGAGGAVPADEAAAAERQRQWRLQSPWMFGEPTARDLAGPNSDTGTHYAV